MSSRSAPRRPAARRPLGALVALALLAASAQDARAQRTGALAGLSLAGGVDGRGLAGAAHDPGISALVGFDVTHGGSPVQARLTGTFFDRDTPANAQRGTGRAATRFGGLGLDVTVGRRAGRVQPYLLAGAGAYRLREEREDAPLVAAAAGPFARGDVRLADTRLVDDRTSLALTVGGGVTAPLGAVRGFVEARYTSFPGGARVQSAYLPIVVGVRF